MKVTVTQLAAYVGKSERTVHRWLASGKWPHTRLPGGLIEIADTLVIAPEEGQESIILAALQRIEQKLDALSARVDTLSARQPQVRLTPARPAPSNAPSGLPGGLVSWRSFANLHGISEGTARKAIDSGRLSVVEGEWRVGKALIRGALDAAGRARFYSLYHSNQHWQDCTECPHVSTD